jgi:ABC-type dipeptide/oligopeptide/nickel transport system permease subunit
MRIMFRFAHRSSAQVGLVVGSLILLLALIGPLFAPHSPAESINYPFAGPSSQAILGTDVIGRDVLSRLLYGGRTLLLLSLTATLIAYCVGLTIGLTAGYVRSLDGILMRAVDVILAFPALLFLLVLATGAPHSEAALVLGVATVHLPGIARIVRTATLEVSVKGYVEAAVIRGERTASVLWHEVLPNVMSPVLADVGLRFSGSILLIASVNFLGLGLKPPAADWALMIAENRVGITLQPWVILVPALLLAALTISVNLIADAIAQSMGRSAEYTTAAR